MISVVKIGGAIVDNPEQLSMVLDAIASAANPTILVHGGGRVATEMAQRLDLPQQIIGGKRITDANTLRIVTMVYAGWINKSIVSALQARGVDAIGVTGADADLIRARQRSTEPIDFGFVGDVECVNTQAIHDLMSLPSNKPATHRCLVVAPITHDGCGTLLNTNADTIANEIAQALLPDVELTYAFEYPGVMTDVCDQSSVVLQLSEAAVSDMADKGQIHAGMLPKLENAFCAAKAGVQRVRITRYDAIHTEDGTWILP